MVEHDPPADERMGLSRMLRVLNHASPHEGLSALASLLALAVFLEGKKWRSSLRI